MPGPGDLWAWLQSIGGGGAGPGPGNVGPVNGFISDPTQTPPNPPLFKFGGFHPENILQGHAGASLGRFTPNFPVNSAQMGGDSGGVDLTAANASPLRPAPAPMDPYGLTRAPPPPPFNWLTSTGAGMSAPAGSPSAAPGPAAAPITPYDRRAPTGPLAATPSGQGGIGSDYAASARNMPLKRKAGAPNLGYYAPTTGNAQRPNPMQYTDPNDPRIYRG